MSDLIGVWNDYYSDTTADTALKDKNFFDLEVGTIIREVGKEIERKPRASLDILELGSGTGYLAKATVEDITKQSRIPVSYIGVDFSDVGVAHAKDRNITGCEFIVSDFLEFLEGDKRRYDMVVSQRSIMAILDADFQLRLLQMIKQCLWEDGLGIFSEATERAANEVNRLRKQLGLDPFEQIWHSRYLNEDQLKEVFSSVTVLDFASTYWLITRVVYPYFQKPVHNTPLHEFAASLPQTGEHGLVKLFLVRP